MRKIKKTIILNDVLVSHYAAEGKSIAKIDGKVIFIEQVVPGDVVDIKLTKNKKDWAEAYPLTFKKYSDNRVLPFCNHFLTCGGCQWQMLPYKQQLEYKHQQVIDNLQRIAKVPLPPIMPIVGCDETVGYRNKLEYTFSTKKFIPKEEFNKDEPVDIVGAAGFHVRGFFDRVVEISTCHLQEEPTNAIRNEVANFAKQHQLPFYDIRNHTGWLRNMMIRIATTKEIMVNIVVAYYNEEMISKLMQFIQQQFPSITTLLYTINSKLNDSIYDLQPVPYFGNGYITEKLEDYSFKIGAKSFFQTNTKQAEKLYSTTKEFAELTGKEIVYDLYCGTGSIGIFVSALAKKIIGVETVTEAIEDAKENAIINNLSNTHFFAGDVIDICTSHFFETHGKPDVVITDPPRAGMHEKLVNKLLEMEAPLIVYVSCNPATQARDVALLHKKYDVIKVQPVDMFPHTHHIENVMQLKLRTAL